ncbi:hypothetical protein BLNAU_24982 [Blattamonas nauphoetae]|uniref:Uncharacterized protein n=1 Tax=Blattamonas nauphoetae TaxID=2049346 RepID=A0ABQ9WKX0_9EUKA|nr:hypothetical protein BLNAU_24982 [Blattamonas nauphoetae]
MTHRSSNCPSSDRLCSRPSEVPATGVVGGWVRGQFDVVSDFVALFSQHLSRSPPRLFSSDSFVVFRIEHFGPRSTLINPDTITPNEIFDSSLFDEADNEKLTRSLVRCKSVCELVGAEKCILDIEHFIDRTVSVLGTSDSLLRAAAGALFNLLEDVPCVSPCCLICGIDSALPSAMAPRRTFDWDGLINADLRELQPFSRLGVDKETASLNLSRCTNTLSRIITIFEDIIQRLDGADDDLNLISYCLLISLRFNRDFPPTLTSILTLYPEIEAHTLLPSENIYLWLCHSSQPTQTASAASRLPLRANSPTEPLAFFLHDSEPDAELSHSLLNTSLCGFHALCRRGMHLDVMEQHQPLHSHVHISVEPSAECEQQNLSVWVGDSTFESFQFDFWLFFIFSDAPVFLRSKFPDLCGMMLSAAIVVTCHRPDRQKVSCGDSTTPVHDWDAALGSFSEGKRRDSDKRSCHLSWSVRPLVDL